MNVRFLRIRNLFFSFFDRVAKIFNERMRPPSQRMIVLLLVLAGFTAGISISLMIMKIQGGYHRFRDDALNESPPSNSKNVISLTQAEISNQGIETRPVGSGDIVRKFSVAGTVEADSTSLVRVAAKVQGVVSQLRVRLGANVKKNEVIAIIDSREIAEAKSEYLAALVGSELQTNLYQREKGLFEKKITAENLYLKAKAAYTEAQLRLDLARQKLSSLDMSAEEIAHLRNQPLARLREKEIFAPITGKVLERLVNLGQPVSGDTQLYVIADLSEIELYLSVPIANLPELSRGQNVTLSAPDGTQYNGKIEIINPMITPETRMAKVIAYVDTPNLSLNPGTLLTAEIEKSRTAKKIIIPLQSVQTINNQPIVFVRTNAGFEDRSVDLGERDQVSVEVLAGLSAGEIIAMSNTHFLKTLALAEFGQK